MIRIAEREGLYDATDWVRGAWRGRTHVRVTFSRVLAGATTVLATTEAELSHDGVTSCGILHGGYHIKVTRA
jgi:hypothetical protein